jgi:dynein heavy chain
VVKIWVHEIMRVFSDRLINDEDRETLLSAVKETVKNRFVLNFDSIFGYLDTLNSEGKKDGTIDTFEIRALMWTDVMNPPGALVKRYEESIDFEKL